MTFVGVSSSRWTNNTNVNVHFVCVQSIIFDEVDLTDASVAESSTKNVNNSFTVRPRPLPVWVVFETVSIAGLNGSQSPGKRISALLLSACKWQSGGRSL